MSDYQKHLAVGQQAAQAAGKILLQYFGKAVVSQKSSQNLVTEADWASEKAVIDIIQNTFPEHRFLQEEGASTAQGHEDHVWVIDPLDATNNYAHGIPHFSVSIAYVTQGQTQVGIVWDPLREELYHTIRGQGAYLNQDRLAVSQRNTLPESILATGFFYDRGQLMERTLESIHALFKKNIRGIRRTGGAALDLCWVAAGRFEGFFEYQLAPWDYAAGALLVTEAGGHCTDRYGQPLELHSKSVIAANTSVHPLLTETVRYPDPPAEPPAETTA